MYVITICGLWLKKSSNVLASGNLTKFSVYSSDALFTTHDRHTEPTQALEFCYLVDSVVCVRMLHLNNNVAVNEV